tara:strand:+ start:64 stop:495 length:432 start_codon:yes stop_codon:yes gene_type:complete
LIEKNSLNLLEVEKFSKKFSKKIKLSNIILLMGDLGSGKTTIIRFLIKNIYLINNKTCPKIIPSPSFSILQTYNLKKFTINHYDFYRIYKIQEIYELGFLESLDNNITFIEWPEIIMPLISNYKYNIIKIKIVDNFTRKIDTY